MAKVLSKKEWKKRKKIYAYAKLGIAVLLAVLILGVVLFGVLKVFRNLFSGSTEKPSAGSTMKQELDITELFLTPNQYSRPQNELKEVKGIVIHYVSNAGASAVSTRNYFEGLKDGTQKTAESSHFIIGLNGEIVQCIPLSEVACGSGERNSDTISIEFCHPQIDGAPGAETYQALVKLTAYLCREYNLTEEAVMRHYDINGENCPKYFAEQEGKWAAFLAEVKTMLAEMNSVGSTRK